MEATEHPFLVFVLIISHIPSAYMHVRPALNSHEVIYIYELLLVGEHSFMAVPNPYSDTEAKKTYVTAREREREQ